MKLYLSSCRLTEFSSTMAIVLLIFLASDAIRIAEAASVTGKNSTTTTTTAKAVVSSQLSASMASELGSTQRSTVDISAAPAMPSGRRSSAAAATAVVVNPDSDDLTGSVGSDSTRKWRAARRQMLRRVFMLLSSNAAGESAAEDSMRGERDSSSRPGGSRRGRADKTDIESVAADGDDGRKEKNRRYRHGKLSTAAVAHAVRPRQPTATIGNVRLSVSEADGIRSKSLKDDKLSGGSGQSSSTTTSLKNNVIKQIDSEIVCPEAEDGIRYFRCPSPDWSGVYQCIDDHALCDRTVHCPNGEDEDHTACMFHQMAMNYFKLLMDSFIALAQTKK